MLWLAETNNLAKLSAKKPVNKGNLGGWGFAKLLILTMLKPWLCSLEKPGKSKDFAAAGQKWMCVFVSAERVRCV